MKVLSPRKELIHLRILFFLFGLGIMSWVPRYPEVKAGLGLDNGAFGSLISSGAIGSVVSLLTVGHVVHTIGVRKVLHVASFFLMATLIVLSHTHSAVIFFFANILFLASIRFFNRQGYRLLCLFY